MLSTEDDEVTDARLAQLMRIIEEMVVVPRWRDPITWITCEECGAWVDSELVGPDGAGECKDGGFRCSECRFASEEP